MNCFKGGSFIQLCGWLGTYDVWTGVVSVMTVVYLKNRRCNLLPLIWMETLKSLHLPTMVLQPIFDKSYATFGRSRCGS